MTKTSALRAVWTKPEFIAAVFVALVFGGLISRLWTGDFLNAYPYMSDDGFDWVTQGVALVEFISGEDRSPWPILRPPLFVGVMAVDHLIGVPGLMFLLVQMFATGLLAFVMARFASRRGAARSGAILAGIAAPFSILGFYSVWVLSDALAVALMTASAAAMLRALARTRQVEHEAEASQYAAPVVLAILAGLTQTYGLIPLLVISSIHAFFRLLNRRSVWAWGLPLAAAAGSAAAVFGLHALWGEWIPHGMRPKNFGLLKLSADMAPFYSNVWPLVFGTFIPLFVWCGVRYFRMGALPSLQTVSLAATTGAFATLTFLYQWEESRMTFLYVPFFIFTVLSAFYDYADTDTGRGEARWKNAALTTTVAACVLLTVTVFPGDYWRPSIAQTRIAPQSTWIFETLKAQPVDRYDLRYVCADMTDVCAAANLRPQSSPYRDMMLSEYKRRKVEP